MIIDSMLRYKGRMFEYIKIHPFFLAFSAIFFFIISSFFLTPSLLFNAKPWAEMATNYYDTSLRMDFISGFFVKDAGYIPLFPRLLSQIYGLFLGPYEFMIMLKLSGVLFCFFSLFYFTHSKFRIIIKNDLLRVFLGIYLFMISGFEIKTAINFTYFGFFYCSYILLYSINENSTTLRTYEKFLFLLFCLSKPVFIIFLGPLFIFFKKNKNKDLVLLSSIGLLVQIFVLLQSMTAEHLNLYSKQEHSLVEKVFSTIVYGPMYFSQSILGKNLFNAFLKVSHYLPSVLGTICIVGIFYWLKKNKKPQIPTLYFVYLLFGVSFLNSFGQADLINLDFNLASFRIWRVNWAAICSSFFLLFYFVDQTNLLTITNHRKKLTILSFIYIISMGNQNLYFLKNSYETHFKNIEWNKESLQKNSCLPIAPPPWKYCFPEKK